jgi:hypothetical protein
VPKGVAKLFGWLLLVLVDMSGVDHHVMLVRDPSMLIGPKENASTRMRISAGIMA